MKCPHDNADLMMTERQGIEIDYCPACRGIWLDRGELDKIVERSAAAAVPPPAAPHQAAQDRSRDDRDHGGRYGESGEYGERAYGQGRRRKRESFLGELFDF